ncbi:MAG: DUF2752 domain-containing protein [Planctomycetes bacterium]|nr:DUF2752 domain-containing protein [Planctomycetota bacterium]
MPTSQQIIESKIFSHATVRVRLKCGLTALVLASLWTIFFLGARGQVDIGRWFDPCGFKQNYNLPCPTCGITTSAIYFSQGRILKSFYVQPAGGFICSILAIMLFFAFFTAVFGIYFRFLGSFLAEIKIKYVFLVFIIVILGGWAVVFARAVAEKGQY